MSILYDFEAETQGTVNPTGFTVESGDWQIRYDGVILDPFGFNGMWNSMVYKNAENDYWCFSSSAWGVQPVEIQPITSTPVGLSIMHSTDKRNWEFVKYMPLPVIGGVQMKNAWDCTIIKETGTYYMFISLSGAATDYNNVTQAHIYLFTSTNLTDWTYVKQVMSAVGYGHGHYRFGSTYYLYYCTATVGVCIATSTTIDGTYTLVQSNIVGGYAELPRIYLDGSTYRMFINTTSYGIGCFHSSAPSGASWIYDGPLTWSSTPDWCSTQSGIKGSYSPTMIWESDHYEMWFVGRGASNGELTGSMTGYAVGGWPNGPWNPVTYSRKAYKMASSPSGIVTTRTTHRMEHIDVTVRVRSSTDNTVAGVMWRAALDNSSYYACYVNASDDKVYLMKSGWQVVASASLGFTDGNGHSLDQFKYIWKDIRVVHTENHIDISVNGISLLSVDDSSVTGLGYIKLFAKDGPAWFGMLLVSTISCYIEMDCLGIFSLFNALENIGTWGVDIDLSDVFNPDINPDGDGINFDLVAQGDPPAWNQGNWPEIGSGLLFPRMILRTDYLMEMFENAVGLELTPIDINNIMLWPYFYDPPDGDSINFYMHAQGDPPSWNQVNWIWPLHTILTLDSVGDMAVSLADLILITDQQLGLDVIGFMPEFRDIMVAIYDISWRLRYRELGPRLRTRETPPGLTVKDVC